MYLNGEDELSINGISGNGTAHLAILTGQSLLPTDWVVMAYQGSTVADGVSDSAGNVWNDGTPDDQTAFALGLDGNNNIDLSLLDPTGTEFENVVFLEMEGRGGNDTLTGNDLTEDWIEGGAGADVLTGNSSTDTFGFAQGDSPQVTSMNLGGNGVLDTGDTFGFTNGVDRVTDFAWFDSEHIELSTPVSSFFASELEPIGFAGVPADGLAPDQGYYAVEGSFNVGTNTFTVNIGGGADTLIVWDGDASSNVTQTAIVLQNVNLSHLILDTGWIQGL
jgi:hypothetical protein